MTRTDQLLWTWSSWRWARRVVLVGLLALVLYLNATDVGSRVSVPYFAAVAGLLPILLLATFIHARDLVSAAALRLAEQQRQMSGWKADINRSIFDHFSVAATVAIGTKQQIPAETEKKIDDLEALRDRIDAMEEAFEDDEEPRMQEFGERWAALLICIVEVAATGEAAALIPLASPTPALPPAILSGVAAAVVLLLLTWAVSMLVRFTTQPVFLDGDDEDDEEDEDESDPENLP